MEKYFKFETDIMKCMRNLQHRNYVHIISDYTKAFWVKCEGKPDNKNILPEVISVGMLSVLPKQVHIF